jgi:hypothetical protein
MTEDQISAYIDTAAANLGLVIAPEWKPNVAMFFGVAQGMAKLVEATGATAATEAAPTFEPRSNS